MTMQGVKALPAGNVPQAYRYRMVKIAAGEGFAIWTESHRTNINVVTESIETLATDNVPQAYCLVITTAGEGFAIWTEGHRPDRIGVSMESIETLATDNIP
ncbi:hypothetical protein KDAU_04110 [Dictyobacter aurantiacus]|uniref:Uncharacterized protein n=1 Tax=Dictyobacter aurantiacus TaxID=1936993 RepID=A0A401Z8B5_9CHLR|nr:hypothetical protein KDAU_04110 [Dictyobacter aurantiacus]